MAPSQKKRKTEINVPKDTAFTAQQNGIHISNLIPATDEDKRQWQGFCEIENEPAFFNVMLREFGVKGVKVYEVWGLNEELLFLPQPVYGMIFLFRYRGDDVNKQEASCPEHIWFANQTHSNACATVSLLNIINNIPNVDLGEHLRNFKNFTIDFTPALRGDQIGNFEFVKQIHNSFARKMDMLNIDLALENEFDDRRKPKKKQCDPSGSKRRGTVTDEDYLDENASFHFIAYIPINNEVWKLDGLDRQPEKLGSCEDGDWLSVIKPVLQTRMAEYEEGQIEFGLLALCQDPLTSHRVKLSANIKSIVAVHTRLDILNPDWKIFVDDGIDGEISGSSTLSGPDTVFGITDAALEGATTPSSVAERSLADCPAKLMTLRQELIKEQVLLRASILREEHSKRDDERRANDCRHDYGPMIYAWLRMLAEKDGLLKELVQEPI